MNTPESERSRKELVGKYLAVLDWTLSEYVEEFKRLLARTEAEVESLKKAQVPLTPKE